MSKKSTAKKLKRAELLDRLNDLGRRVSTQTVFLHQAIAQSIGLNATDTKCVDLILSGEEDSVTAGWLSDATGLTTGAITHILDRLEKRQVIERVRDTRDRRKIFIRVRPESLLPVYPKYEVIGKAYLELADEYDDRELRVICDYMERACKVSKAQLAQLIADRRGSAE
jgi:DNA-binding MarR family transcriptional regulator